MLQEKRRSWNSGVAREIAALSKNDLLIDLREIADESTQATYFTRAEILRSGGMRVWFDQQWHWKTVADQQGQWPWAMNRILFGSD